MKPLRIAVVGATGMVGRTFLQVLQEINLPQVEEYVFFSSARSAGSTLPFMKKDYVVQELTTTSFDSGFDAALFSAGGDTSKQYAPIAASKGCVVIDNSSCWRMDPDVPLVVPEVNPSALQNRPKNIIANPNCSTIQAMLPLKALQDAFGLKRVIYSTYQAVSGAGVAGNEDLVEGARAFVEGTDYEPKKFPYPIFSNCLPHIDTFLPDGYTKEEQKMMDETRKILGDANLGITATTVRVPVLNSHSESINVETRSPFTMEQVRECLANFHKNLVLQDNTAKNEYPMPLYASGHNEVYVGRLRRDDSVENGLNLWCVADNIRKGAATNTVQILQCLIENEWIG